MSSLGIGFNALNAATTASASFLNSRTVIKRKALWLFKIPGISASGINALPPIKAARPNISFKEIEVQHLTETVYFPGKPEFKEFDLTLYDFTCNNNPIIDWLKTLYNPKTGNYNFIINDDTGGQNFKINSTLELYDGCKNCVERWVYENCWPKVFDFQDLDSAANDVTMINLTMRYDRVYIDTCGSNVSSAN